MDVYRRWAAGAALSCWALCLASGGCSDAQAGIKTFPGMERPPYGDPAAPAGESSGDGDQDEATADETPVSPSVGTLAKVRIRSRVLYGALWVQSTSVPMDEVDGRTAMAGMHRDLAHRPHDLTLIRMVTLQNLQSNGPRNFAAALREVLLRAAEAQKQSRASRSRP